MRGAGEEGEALISYCYSTEVKDSSYFPRSHQAICEAFIGLINTHKYTDPKVR